MRLNYVLSNLIFESLRRHFLTFFLQKGPKFLIHLSHGTKFYLTSPVFIQVGGGGLQPNDLTHSNSKVVFDHTPY